MLWSNMTTTSVEEVAIFECTSLISNSFTINSAGKSSAERRAESRNRGAQRRLNMMSQRVNFDVECPSSPEKMATDEMSFYSGNSPAASPRPCSISPTCMEMSLLSPENSPCHFTAIQDDSDIQIVRRRQLTVDDYESSSRDSGYSTSIGMEGVVAHNNHHHHHHQHNRNSTQQNSDNNKIGFKFVEPCGTAPRRLEPSPPRTMTTTMTNQTTAITTKTVSPKTNFRLFNSLSTGSMESMDDDYLELLEIESLDDDNQFNSHRGESCDELPSNLTNLISGNIMATRTTPENKRPLVRRCLSLNESETTNHSRQNNLMSPRTPEVLKTINENLTPYSSRMGVCENSGRCFKRPEPPTEAPIQSKRYRSENDEQDKENIIIRRPSLVKSMSMNDAVIMTALAKSAETELIGDFSKPYCLPLMDGRHQDLKSISVHTMAKLLRGEFWNNVSSFKVIDCRYPYEYEGGHIQGADNLYTQEQILESLVSCKLNSATVEPSEMPKRNILIFHCEFSSERGPKLSRFLRNLDRSRNENSYPALHYPEIYLLNGGYKDFFESYAELCTPNSYRPMLHPSFVDSYRHFRAKSKSWNGDSKKSSGSMNRLTKSRSRLVL